MDVGTWSKASPRPMQTYRYTRALTSKPLLSWLQVWVWHIVSSPSALKVSNSTQKSGRKKAACIFPELPIGEVSTTEFRNDTNSSLKHSDQGPQAPWTGHLHEPRVVLNSIHSHLLQPLTSTGRHESPDVKSSVHPACAYYEQLLG